MSKKSEKKFKELCKEKNLDPTKVQIEIGKALIKSMKECGFNVVFCPDEFKPDEKEGQ